MHAESNPSEPHGAAGDDPPPRHTAGGQPAPLYRTGPPHVNPGGTLYGAA